MSIPALKSCQCGHYGYQHDHPHGDCLAHQCDCDEFQHPVYTPPSERGQAKRRPGAYAGRGQVPRDDR